MPAPIAVQLQPHSPEWAEAARREMERLRPVLGANLIAIHHIGSTAIPGISAKPILDLMPAVRDILALDAQRVEIEALGYAWWGEFGLRGRRYCTLSDPVSAARKVQLHCFAGNTVEVERHLAFRDYLIAHRDLAAEYEALKARCRDLHPSDSHAYTDCKNGWIRRIEGAALQFRAQGRTDVARAGGQGDVRGQH